MEVAVLVMSILGCVFGLLGLVAAGVTAVIVIGWRNSTHKVQFVQPQQTTVEWDTPYDPLAHTRPPASTTTSVPLEQHLHDEDLDEREARIASGGFYDDDLDP